MELFSDENVNLEILKKRAFNYRWAEVPDGIIPLTAADPDFPVAPEIKKALTEYIDGGYFSYTPKRGFPDFIQAISKYLMETKNELLDCDHILPIDSAARGMYVIAQTLLQPGDEAIVFDPVDYLFGKSVLAAGATQVLFPAVVKNGRIDIAKLESYITKKTKMLCLCNPHNPLGLLYTNEDLRLMLDLAKKYNLWIMNDEIWSDITYPEKSFVSILTIEPSMNDHVFSVFGFSKSFGIAGLRAGCIYTTNTEVFKKIVDISAVMTTAGGISSLSQIAGIACLNDSRYWLAAFKEYLTTARDYVYNRICAIPGLSMRKPEATYLAYIDISSLGMKSEDFVEYLKREMKVAVVAGGEKFFGKGSEGYIRICFATSTAILEEGLNRFEAGVRKLQAEQRK